MNELTAEKQPAPFSQNPGSARLEINLQALQQNYKILSQQAHQAHCGAAIKADAYGLGVERVSKLLHAAGCRYFFVARPQEGQKLREILKGEKTLNLKPATIYVLDGYYPATVDFYQRYQLTPCLASMDQITAWVAETAGGQTPPPCALHVDTGINRLGLSMAEHAALLQNKLLSAKLNITLIMSHLACADDPPHPMNKAQLSCFQTVRGHHPTIPASLANSGGIFLGPEYHFDLVRPGIALYGGAPTPNLNPMQPVVHLFAKILALRDIETGETVGYSATWQATRPSRIAILGIGYSDGISRQFSSKSGQSPQGPTSTEQGVKTAQVYAAGQHCPIVGRVSMDMITVDVTDIPRDQLKTGMEVEIFGRHISVDQAATSAATISYELLTQLGKRYVRNYSLPDSDNAT